MKALTILNRRNWNPFNEMDELHNLFFGGRNIESREASPTVSEWSPLVDVIESDENYSIKAELPEVTKNDISVKVEDGVLTIAGERKSEHTSEDKKVHRIERSYGKFVRSFRVPENADAAKVAAEFKDGVLRVTLPKVPEAKPQAIEIAVA